MSDDGNDDTVPTEPVTVWIGLIVMACISFWAQAVVTEERFVPALNLIATKFNIPDDVAGATLMAAGASSPELLSSFVSLFITHSSLGLGTIVGSEIFNQLIICAGAVFASRTGSLILDPAILMREVGFYGLSIILLYVALLDTGPLPEDPTGEDHIFISFADAALVFGGYLAYIWVCANMDSVKEWCSALVRKIKEPRGEPLKSGSNGEKSDRYGSMRTSFGPMAEGLPFLQEKSLVSEPVGNFTTEVYSRTTSGERAAQFQQQPTESPSFLATSIRNVKERQTSFELVGLSVRPFEFLVHTEKPSESRSIYTVEDNSFEDRLSCFMWQRSYFYTNARFATHGWHLRWFSLLEDKIYSVPDRTNSEWHRVEYPVMKEIQVDEKRLIVRMIPYPGTKKRSFYLLAPTPQILEQVVGKMEDIMEYHANKATEEGTDVTKPSEHVDEGNKANFASPGNKVEEVASLIEFPFDGSNLEIIFFCLLFPFRFLMHWTIADVRVLDEQGQPKATLTTAFLAVTSCLLWLIVFSYVMVTSLEDLAELLNVPDAIVGVTVSAAGTSLPNYVASKVAAEKGFGNMAVSNAFGSNTFNIMVGLGLPWCLYTSFATGFEPYSGLKDEGIGQSVAILASVWLVFVVIIIPSNFTLHKWHGWLFLGLYVAYVAFSVGQLYW